jgi:hypothetical protein
MQKVFDWAKIASESKYQVSKSIWVYSPEEIPHRIDIEISDPRIMSRVFRQIRFAYNQFYSGTAYTLEQIKDFERGRFGEFKSITIAYDMDSRRVLGVLYIDKFDCIWGYDFNPEYPSWINKIEKVSESDVKQDFIPVGNEGNGNYKLYQLILPRLNRVAKYLINP